MWQKKYLRDEALSHALQKSQPVLLRKVSQDYAFYITYPVAKSVNNEHCTPWNGNFIGRRDVEAHLDRSRLLVPQSLTSMTQRPRKVQFSKRSCTKWSTFWWWEKVAWLLFFIFSVHILNANLWLQWSRPLEPSVKHAKYLHNCTGIWRLRWVYI